VRADGQEPDTRREQRARWQMTAKPRSIKGAERKSGGCVRKAVELTSGDLPFVLDSGLRIEKSILTGRQKSAEGVLGTQVLKAGTVPGRGYRKGK